MSFFEVSEGGFGSAFFGVEDDGWTGVGLYIVRENGSSAAFDGVLSTARGAAFAETTQAAPGKGRPESPPYESEKYSPWTRLKARIF